MSNFQSKLKAYNETKVCEQKLFLRKYRLTNKNLKLTVLNMLMCLMKNVGKELKEIRRIMSQQIENTDKKTKIIKMVSNRNSGAEKCNK